MGKFLRVDDSEMNERSIFFATCALFSSVMASALTQPADAIRTYIQLDPEKNKSFMGTAKNIYERKGFRGFFAGFIPRSLRRTLISVMSWTIYEKLTLTPNEDLNK